MPFSFNLYSSTLLVFSFHILAIGLLELRTGIRERTGSAYWLSLMLFLLVLYISPFMLGYAGWYGEDGYREALFYLPLQQLFFIGPVFMFYLKNLLDPGYSFKKYDWGHFVPGIIYLLYSLVLFIYDMIQGVYFYMDGRDKDFDSWYQVAGFISMIIYFLLSWKIYQQYRKRIFENLSYAEEVAYSWVRTFLFVFLIVLILRALFFIINPEWDNFGRKFWYYLCISVVGYYLAILGYRQSLLQNTSWIRTDNFSMPSEEVSENMPEEENNEEYVKLLVKIDQAMHDRQLFKNPTLTLNDLAEHLDTTTKNISRAINTETGLNFNDYINRFRVNAFIEKIRAESHPQHTLLGIAMACGFNSKSTFNRAFKKHQGVSPNEYVRKHLKRGFKS